MSEKTVSMSRSKAIFKTVVLIALIAISVVYIFPILMVLLNSFKKPLYISDQPFNVPTGDIFAGFTNYVNGIAKIGFFKAAGFSLWITVASVLLIILLTSMLAWYITRVKNKFTNFIYMLLAFSMIVPFQMIMFSMSKFANILHLDNPIGILVLYVGFGAGMSTFMFVGFIKSLPIALEEAAMIDGCSPVKTFFLVVFPLLKPTAITIAILDAMWIWNDYLLPYLTIGTEYRTIPIAIQYLRGGYGSIDWGAMMAMLVLAIIPIVVFYMICQKYIIEGVIAGAVKG